MRAGLFNRRVFRRLARFGIRLIAGGLVFPRFFALVPLLRILFCLVRVGFGVLLLPFDQFLEGGLVVGRPRLALGWVGLLTGSAGLLGIVAVLVTRLAGFRLVASGALLSALFASLLLTRLACLFRFLLARSWFVWLALFLSVLLGFGFSRWSLPRLGFLLAFRLVWPLFRLPFRVLLGLILWLVRFAWLGFSGLGLRFVFGWLGGARILVGRFFGLRFFLTTGIAVGIGLFGLLLLLLAVLFQLLGHLVRLGGGGDLDLQAGGRRPVPVGLLVVAGFDPIEDLITRLQSGRTQFVQQQVMRPLEGLAFLIQQRHAGEFLASLFNPQGYESQLEVGVRGLHQQRDDGIRRTLQILGWVEQRHIRPLIGLDLNGIDGRLRITLAGLCLAFDVIVPGKRAVGAEVQRPCGGKLLAIANGHFDFFPLGQGVVSVGHDQQSRFNRQIRGGMDHDLRPLPGVNVATRLDFGLQFVCDVVSQGRLFLRASVAAAHGWATSRGRGSARSDVQRCDRRLPSLPR